MEVADVLVEPRYGVRHTAQTKRMGNLTASKAKRGQHTLWYRVRGHSFVQAESATSQPNQFASDQRR
jgi:hypothetical protein